MDSKNEYGVLERQKYLLPMLEDIDRFCRENGIQYSLSDGTLLGAVRHKGFIPWDDDIDLTLDRENFKKLMRAADRLPGEYEIVEDLWIRRVSRRDNPQKHDFPPEGCLDLFVFDNVPDQKYKERIQVFLLKTLQGMIKKKVIYNGFSLPKKLLLFTTHALGKPVPFRWKIRLYDSISQWGNRTGTGKIARFNGSFKGITHARYPASVIDSYTELEFEGRRFLAMQGWDSFLRVMYGDYMTPPEKDRRKTSHVHIGAKS